MSRILIQLSHIFKYFNSNLIFDDLCLSIHDGEIFSLIGENGSGKTTLLKILAEHVLADQGQINKISHLTIGFLPQEILLENFDLSVRSYLENQHLINLEQQMKLCLEKVERLPEWSDLHEHYEQLGGYRQIPIEKVLEGLKLDEEILNISMGYLSSGQRIRVALAKALIENPDLLLLDEPTNHLDQEMTEWLKNNLQLRRGATVIVSHDRTFINAVCNRLIELKEGKLSYYGGNYDFYLEEHERLVERQIKAYEAQQEEKAFLKQKIKSMTFSRSKPRPPSDRNIMSYDRKGEFYQQSIKHRLDDLKSQLANIENHPLFHPKPKNIKGLRFIPDQPLSSSVAIEFEGINKFFEEKKLFSNFSHTLFKGDRVILTGPNGSGKTTLLRCILNLTGLDSGQIRYASNAKIAYLDQEVDQFPMHQTPMDYFKQRFHLAEEDLRKELHKSAIGKAELLERPFSTLSVGQRKRLMLLVLMLEKPNILLLDEPTNHLDLLTIEALEKALLQFEGTLLAISHDQTFIQKIATDIWIFPNVSDNLV